MGFIVVFVLFFAFIALGENLSKHFNNHPSLTEKQIAIAKISVWVVIVVFGLWFMNVFLVPVFG